MDTKGAAEAMLKAAAAAPMGAEEEAMLKALARKEGAAPAPATAGPWTTEGVKGAASAAVERYWASLKSQARAAGEYTTLKARAAGEYTTLKARAAGEYTTLKARAAGEYTTLKDPPGRRPLRRAQHRPHQDHRRSLLDTVGFFRLMRGQ